MPDNIVNPADLGEATAAHRHAAEYDDSSTQVLALDEPDAVLVPETEQVPGWRRRLPVLIAGGVVALLALIYLIDWFATSDEVAKGTRIAGVDVGGLTTDEAVATLTSALSAVEQPFSVSVHDSTATLDPTAAGLRADIAATVTATGTRSANPFTRIAALFGRTTDVPLQVEVDASALDATLTALAAITDVDSVEGSVSVRGSEVVVVDPIIGRALDVPAAALALTNAWSTDPRGAIGLALPVTDSPVRASAGATAAAAAEARALLSGPLTIAANGTTLTISLDILAASTTVEPNATDGFAVAIDEPGILGAVRPQIDATQTQPIDATVSIVNDAPVLAPGVNGRTVDWSASDAAFSAALRAPDHLFTVIYTETPPSISTEAMQTLGIKEVVSEFTTGGFVYASGQNVKTVAAKVQGAIVMPGETWSLNGFTGPRGVAEGYIEAGIIQEGVPAKAVGGGISQFATTLFNASYFAGMEDIEHKAHSYYISRYPAGREATVFEAEDGTSIIDVKFKNIYPTAILIQTVWTESDITVRFWGTKTVNVDSIPGDRYDYTNPPVKRIPYGEKCTASNGTSGFSIDVTRVISDLAGNEISRVTKTTVYNGQYHIICEPPPVTTTASTPPTTGG